MPEFTKSKNNNADVLQIFEEKALAQWDLLDSIYTEIQKNKHSLQW